MQKTLGLPLSLGCARNNRLLSIVLVCQLCHPAEETCTLVQVTVPVTTAECLGIQKAEVSISKPHLQEVIPLKGFVPFLPKQFSFLSNSPLPNLRESFFYSIKKNVSFTGISSPCVFKCRKAFVEFNFFFFLVWLLQDLCM